MLISRMQLNNASRKASKPCGPSRGCAAVRRRTQPSTPLSALLTVSATPQHGGTQN